MGLPELGLKRVKAKIDTGARSSSLHAFELETFKKAGDEYVRFKVHPKQRDDSDEIEVEAKVLEFRTIRSSSGEENLRPVIVTNVTALGETWPIELTLANRDAMGFRMLLGREAVRGRMLVDSGKSYYGGKPKRKKKRKKT